MLKMKFKSKYGKMWLLNEWKLSFYENWFEIRSKIKYFIIRIFSNNETFFEWNLYALRDEPHLFFYVSCLCFFAYFTHYRTSPAPLNNRQKILNRLPSGQNYMHYRIKMYFYTDRVNSIKIFSKQIAQKWNSVDKVNC